MDSYALRKCPYHPAGVECMSVPNEGMCDAQCGWNPRVEWARKQILREHGAKALMKKGGRNGG